MPQENPRPEVAFMAAALVLVVLPALVVVGFVAFGAGVASISGTDRLFDGDTGWLLLAIFVGWVVLVTAAVLVLISRLIRRTPRS